MSELFETTQLNGIHIRNRFVRSATYEAMAGLDGTVTDQLLDCTADLARGDVGLIITGHAHVLLQGQAGPRLMGIYSDALIPGLRHLVRRWKNGDRAKATCISCNKCFSTLAMDEALHCPVEKKAAGRKYKS